MATLRIRDLGQIKQADLQFGDLTVLVGPQATGKSVVLQLVKLLVDTGYVQEELQRYGMDWERLLPPFLDLYFGEGMRSIWREQSTVTWLGKSIDMKAIARRKRRTEDEKLFFVPAQRVLTLRDGWPRPFTDYAPGDPFAVREFSEKLRLLVEREFTAESLFPQERRLKKAFRELLKRDVFANFHLRIDKVRSQKRLVLGTADAKDSLPYMVWSAGQREFVPLLLGFYWLMPPTKVARRGAIEWVVIEELEMGLHPRAIAVVMLMVFELLHRGIVCASLPTLHRFLSTCGRWDVLRSTRQNRMRCSKYSMRQETKVFTK
ncbi:MAG: ATP-binding protein [Burkholderiales bacterium]|nr:ATP-binding protein [Burkholderiales bacterium]